MARPGLWTSLAQGRVQTREECGHTSWGGVAAIPGVACGVEAKEPGRSAPGLPRVGLPRLSCSDSPEGLGPQSPDCARGVGPENSGLGDRQLPTPQDGLSGLSRGRPDGEDPESQQEAGEAS